MIKNIYFKLLCVVIGISISSCGTQEKKEAFQAFNLSNRDTTVNPADDIFQYVNGKWLKTTEIPAIYPVWGAFLEIRENNQNILASVIKSASKNPAYTEGSDQWKIGQFYSIGMDSLLVEKNGLQPIKPFLEQIDAITDKESLQKSIADLRKYGIYVFFGIYGSPDEKNTKNQVPYLLQWGMGLPDRDYYLKTDPKSLELKNKYQQMVSKMLAFTGYSEKDAQKGSKAILNIETKLAQSKLDKVELRNPQLTYNKMTIAGLSQLTPSVNWNVFLSDAGLTQMDSIIISEPKFMKAVETIINTISLDNIKYYLKWHTIRSYAPSLQKDVVNTHFDFYSKEMRGTQQIRPRWKRVLDEVDNSLGEALGKLYVDSVFPPQAKNKALSMVENIKIAFAERIKKLTWMSDTTKEQALKKLSTFTVKIGYPDEWRNYANLKIETEPEKTSYAGNVINARKFDYDFELSKIGKPVNKKEWGMTPHTVNAYYNPVFNEIVFPAGILQPPFYNYKADEAVNYGGIGAVIGHEISHGFDDQGSQYDADGNLKNWWSTADRKRFDALTKKLVNQYNTYEPLDSIFVNGAFTLGENIGDLGGLAMAYEGLQNFFQQTSHPKEIDGFTAEQRFFISWATCWRTKYREPYLKTLIMTDPHSPAQYRANGPLVNLDPFYAAFDVKEGNKMFKHDTARIKIW